MLFTDLLVCRDAVWFPWQPTIEELTDLEVIVCPLDTTVLML